jgi:hypothetical protein
MTPAGMSKFFMMTKNEKKGTISIGRNSEVNGVSLFICCRRHGAQKFFQNK